MNFEVTRELILKKFAKWNASVSLTYIRRYYQTGTAVALIVILLTMSMMNLLHRKGNIVSVPVSSAAEASLNFSSLTDKIDLPPPEPHAGLPIDVGETSRANKVIYNRIDKSGTRTFLYIIEKLALRNKFNHVSSDIWAEKYTNSEEQKSMITDVNTNPPPLLYDRPVHYIHFPRYGANQPSWISLVRDPIERFVSLFYYKRYGDVRTRPDTFINASDSIVKQTFDDCVLKNNAECSTKSVMQIIPYFCGQGVGCRIPNRWALETAKRNIIDNFVVVGVLEELNTTLFVLENVLPQFFKGAEDAYLSLLFSGVVRGYSSFAGEVPSKEAMAKMKERLALEYELYYFIKERLALMKKEFMARPLLNYILVNGQSQSENVDVLQPDREEVLENEDMYNNVEHTEEELDNIDASHENGADETPENEDGMNQEVANADDETEIDENLKTESLNTDQDIAENEDVNKDEEIREEGLKVDVVNADEVAENMDDPITETVNAIEDTGNDDNSNPDTENTISDDVGDLPEQQER